METMAGATMISEKKLAYYEHVAEDTCSEECQKIITQLVDEVRKLNAEADNLANCLGKHCKENNNFSCNDCVNCMRKAVKVQND